MKAALFLILFLITNFSIIFAQPLSLGIKADILIQNKNIDYEFGPRLVLDYQFEELPFSISGNLGFRYADLSPDFNLSGGYTKTTSSLGVAFNYYPIKWDIEPYVGVGLYYNINDLSTSGILTPDVAGISYRAKNMKNNVSYSLNGGLKFSAKSSIHFIAELVYLFNKPNYTLEKTDTNNIVYTSEEYDTKTDLNALYVSLGVMFDL